MNFFASIGSFLDSVGEFILMLVDSLLTAISVIGNAILMPFYLTGFVPQVILTGAIALVSLAVVKFLIGR